MERQKGRSSPPLLLVLLAALAAGLPLSAAPAPWSPSKDTVKLAELGLDAREKAWLEARTQSGGALKAAIRERLDCYEVAPDGSIKGFDYTLLREFAGTLGLRLDLRVEKTIDAFFSRNGVMPKDLGAPGTTYDFTPDILKSVDLVVGPFGIYPWRQSLMTMLPIYPTRNQLAGRKGEEIRTLKELNGKRIAVIKDSVQQTILTNMAAAEKIKIEFEPGVDESELYRLVAERKADYLLDASVIFAKNVKKLASLGLSPYPEDIVMTGWSVKKEDTVLASILGKFLAASQRNGLFGRLWTEDFQMDFNVYLGAVLSAPQTQNK